MTGVIAIGFSGDLRLVTVCFMGFWVGFMSVGPPQGDLWVSLGVSLGV